MSERARPPLERAEGATPAKVLYEKLRDALRRFAVVREEPRFSSVDLAEMVTLAASALASQNAPLRELADHLGVLTDAGAVSPRGDTATPDHLERIARAVLEKS